MRDRGAVDNIHANHADSVAGATCPSQKGIDKESS